MKPTSAFNVFYHVNQLALLAMSDYLVPLFNGTVWVAPESNEPSSDVVGAVWYATTDMDRWTQNVAVSMTNTVRTDSPARHPDCDGTGNHLEYDVRWQLITLPVVLILMFFGIWAAVIMRP